MAFASIAFKYKRNRFQDPIRPKVILKIDATISLSYRREAALTEYPVEDGADITDHYVIKPKMLSVQGVVSNTPLEFYEGAINVATGVIPNATVRALSAGASSAGQLLIRRGANRGEPAKRAYNYLNELMDKKIPFTFVTRYEAYKNMLITSLDISRSTGTGDSLPFSCELREVRIVSARRGDVNAYLDSINGKSSGNISHGKKVGSPVGTVGTDVNQSILDRAIFGPVQ